MTEYIVTDRVTLTNYAIRISDGQLTWSTTSSTASTEPIVQDTTNTSNYWRFFISDGQLEIESTATTRNDKLFLSDTVTSGAWTLTVSDGLINWIETTLASVTVVTVTVSVLQPTLNSVQNVTVAVDSTYVTVSVLAPTASGTIEDTLLRIFRIKIDSYPVNRYRTYYYRGSMVTFTVVLSVNQVDTATITIKNPMETVIVNAASMTKVTDRIYRYIHQSASTDETGDYVTTMKMTSNGNTIVAQELFTLVEQQ